MRSCRPVFVVFPVFVFACSEPPFGLDSHALFQLTPAPEAKEITTVAGNGISGFTGDGGPAINAALTLPTGIAVDGAGNLYIADQTNQRIRKVTAAGVISTIAGNGTAGFGGDGGPATLANLNFPLGVAVDGAGNLFVADQLNHRIRKIDGAGVITTVAGNGIGGYGGDGGPATNASLQFPSGVLVDAAGNLFIADRNNQRVRKIEATGTISTVAGNGTQGFSGDGGFATAASFSSPADIALDGAGNLYVADQLNERVRKVTPAGIVTTVAGNGFSGFAGDGGPAIDASFSFPLDVSADAAGNIFIADLRNHRIRKVDASGTVTTVAGSGVQGYGGDGGLATCAQLDSPRAVALDAVGNIFIADLFNHRVRRVGRPTTSLIDDLVDAIQDLALPGRGGQAQLNAALSALGQDPPDVQGAINSLQAFINFVNAQSGKKIPPQDAEDLIGAAQLIINLLEQSRLDCP